MVGDTGAASEFETHRPRLFSLAYRMLGSAGEAEDAVQDAYLRWSAADRSVIETPVAWLTKVVTNLCVNRLTSARVRRERYAGPWLPEPVLTDGAAPLGPMETAEQRESVSLALLTLMERLTPAERAVFVLREAFGYGHRETAGILGVSEDGSRQLHRRARQRLAEDRRRFDPSRERWAEVVERFLAAAQGGDLRGLEELLAEDVVAWSDGGGKVSAARRPVVGRDRVVRYFGGWMRFVTPEYELRVVEVNGMPALLALRAGAPVGVLVCEVAGGGVAAVRTVANPDKLGYLARQLGSRPRTWR
ncbi:RNA polymerase sigma-70 factor [Marinactinospora rubrisoli]|uniref:RNA polymerase sigma-70 factor n=1 Tax=Marinactinospora rubrisoli TaxID=2715399 RepID=A0ABW2KNB8_9ACTN